MTKLNQIIAVEKGVKSSALSEMTKQYQLLQKSGLLVGLSRTYQPKDEEGEELPPESTRVQVKAEEMDGHDWNEHQRSLGERHGYYRGARLSSVAPCVVTLARSRSLPSVIAMP